jgi:transcriptional regulator with XRE-family HTH domain
MKKNEAGLRPVLAANLKEQRRIMGISQEKLAELSGLSWQTVNSIECQRIWVRDKTLEALAHVFKIDTFQLLLPPAAKVVLSLKTVEVFQKLAKAKKAYDDKFNEIMDTTANK